MLNLPEYYLLSERPAEIDRTEDEQHVGAYGFNFQTGEFELSSALFNRLMKADNENVVRLSEEEFISRVAELREKIEAKKSG